MWTAVKLYRRKGRRGKEEEVDLTRSGPKARRIQTLRAFRRTGKGAKRKVVSDGHGARVEGKGSMRAKVEGPCKGARVKGVERSYGNIPPQKTAESDSKNFIAEHRAAHGEPWGGGFRHFSFALGSLRGNFRFTLKLLCGSFGVYCSI